jgi:hypothetical protein
MALPFLCVTLLRLVALRQIVAGRGAGARGSGEDAARIADHALPVYTVLVPLLREGNVLPDLVQSLHALDYPAAKLDVLLILETDDTETQAALLTVDLPGNFRSITVPALAPQTKPKALNYALQFARGDFVVVYDAEDRPARAAAPGAADFSRGGARARVRAGPAQHRQPLPQLADAPVHHRIFRAVRRHPAGAGALASAGAAGWHVQPLSARGIAGGRRLGPLQRHRGR